MSNIKFINQYNNFINFVGLTYFIYGIQWEIINGIIQYSLFSNNKFLFSRNNTPELERAQASAIASIIIILIGFLFKQFEPLSSKKADLKGKISFSLTKTFQMRLLMNLHGIKLY